MGGSKSKLLNSNIAGVADDTEEDYDGGGVPLY